MIQVNAKAIAGLLLALSAACTGAVHANGYPNKPIRLIVPFAAGGTADVLSRLIGQRLGQRLGQVVVVENKPGAGTAIGVKHVAEAAPDGYTILYGGVSSQVMNPLINKVDFDPIKDFTPISMINSLPLVLVVKPSLGVTTMQEFLELAKKRVEPITFASAGTGTSNHLAGELLNNIAHVHLLHVPYKSSAPAMNDVLGGHVDSMFDLTLTAGPQIKQGKVRALAITSPQRSPLLPDVPTMRELGMPGGDVDVWTGLYGPAGMPKDVVEKLNAEIVAILDEPDVKEQFATYGALAASSTPDELGRTTKSELIKWEKVVKTAHIAAD